MNQTHRLLSKVLLLGGLLLPSALRAEGSEANAFSVSKLAGEENATTQNESAHRYFRAGDFNKAEVAFERLVASDVSDGQTWYNLGVTQINLGKFRPAVLSFNAALEAGFGETARYHMAYALLSDGEVIGAMDHLRTFLLAQPKHDLAWTLLGHCLETYGRFAQAKECYQKALAINPNQGQALFRLESLPAQTEGRLPDPKVLPGSVLAPKDETVLAVPGEPLPTSRVLSSDGQTTPAHSGSLPPLSEAYHLSSDLPGGAILTPTQETDWSSVKTSSDSQKMSNTSEKTFTPPPPPKVDLPLEDLL